MADEVDPIAEIIKSHVANVNAIMADGIAQTQALCEESVSSVRKKSGLRSQLLDQALASIGITKPGETSYGSPGTDTADAGLT